MSNRKPNHYSVEEMVDAAESKAVSSSGKKTETREVVVQEDGTKVVKVRRRKRKSKSAEQLLATGEETKQSYIKVLLITLATAAILGLLLTGYFFLKISYFNSPDHITNLEKFLSTRMNSEVDIQGYRLGPTSSQIEKIVITSGMQESPYTKGELNDIEFVHRPEAVVLGALSGTEAVAQTGSLVIDFGKEVEKVKSIKGEIPNSIPYNYQDLDIRALKVSLGSEAISPNVSEARGKLLRRADGNVQLFLREGKLFNLNGLPKTLESTILINKGEEVVVQTLKLSNGSVGHVEIKGAYSKVTKLPQTLSANFNRLRLESMDDKLKEIVEARVNSQDGSLQIAPVEKEYRMEANLLVTDGGISLKNFQFLEAIGEKFGKFGYPYIAFNHSSKVKLIISNTGYEFTDIDFERQGEMALVGSINVGYEGRLSGDLKVGLPTAKLIKQFPEANTELFSTSRGYTWFSISLSGTTQKPLDNFSEKFDEVVDALH